MIRHAYVKEHRDGFRGIHADSTDAEILEYTRGYSVTGQFPVTAPRYWVVFTKEGGNQARLWSVIENRGEVSNDGVLRKFDISESGHMSDLRRRLVIGWRAPRAWWMRGATAASYPIEGIADAEPVPFPGFDRLVLSHVQLQAVIREPRYASWRTTLSSVMGVYLSLAAAEQSSPRCATCRPGTPPFISGCPTSAPARAGSPPNRPTADGSVLPKRR